jgi:hypothetical protein
LATFQLYWCSGACPCIIAGMNGNPNRT